LTSRQSNFSDSGKSIRVSRILDPLKGRAAVVAFDHGLHLGPVPGISDPGRMLEQLASAGADAFLVSPGIVRHYGSVFCGRGAPSLILRIDWSNRWRAGSMLGSDEGRTRLIAGAEEAARLGADAVLMYMFLGYEDPGEEADQVEDVARTARECEVVGIGCIIEPMPRGARVGDDPYRPEFVAMGARIACEIGADLLKTDYTGSAETFKSVVAASFRPILIAGGPKTATIREALGMVKSALDAGAAGMFIGRNVFQAPDPVRMMTALVGLIHNDWSLDQAAASVGG